MEQYIQTFSQKTISLLNNLPIIEIAKGMNILQAAFERDGRIYVIGNGGSLALATHWVADFNKTVFNHNIDKHQHRFQAIRLPTTEEELTAWANDVGYEMVFAGHFEELHTGFRCSHCDIEFRQFGEHNPCSRTCPFA